MTNWVGYTPEYNFLKEREIIMNKVYKVIWSKVRNCYVVVSELAKRNGKCKAAKTDSLNTRKRLTDLLSIHTPVLTKAVAAMLLAGMIAVANVAGAATITAKNGTTEVNPASAPGKNSLAAGQNAQAAYNATAYGSNALATANQSIAVGFYASADATQAIAIGSATTDTSKGAQAFTTGAIAIGSERSTYAGAQATGTDAIALGTGANANGTSAIAVGFNSLAAQKNAETGKITAANYAMAVGHEANASVQDAIAVGRGANASAMEAIAVGRTAKATAEKAIAVGRSALSRGQGSISLGASSRVRTDYTIAIGYNAGISRMNTEILPEEGGTAGSYAVAIGSNSGNFTYGYYDSVDYESYAHIKNSIAIGYKAHTHAANAFAIGVSTDATAERSFAIGTSSTSYVKIDKNTGNINDAHLGSSARGQGSITFGDTALVLAEDPRTGGDYERATDTDVNDAIAVGTNSLSQARNAVALGGGISYTYHEGTGNTMTNITKYYDKSKEDPWVDRAEGTGAQIGLKSDGAVAIGGATADVTGINDRTYPTTEANKLKVDNYTPAATIGANAKRAIAIGSGALIGNDAENSVAVGARNIVTGKNATAVGQANQVAGEGSGAFGDPNRVAGDFSFAFGDNNKIGKQEFEIIDGREILKRDETTKHVFAVGDGNEIGTAGNAENINVFGYNNMVEGSKNSVIIGNENGKDDDKRISGDSNIFILGNKTTVEPNISNAVAIGQTTTIGANDTIAIGHSAQATKANSTAFGYEAKASAENSMAFGTSANASKEGSVALGSESVANTDAHIAGYDFTTGKASTDSSNAWNSTHAAVAVGNDATVTRQITGVAAGSADTDAVNVAQLKQVHWNVGIYTAGGTVDKPLDVKSSSVGNNGMNKVEFLAGEGIELSYSTLSSGNNDDGYGIKITNHIAEITPDPENKNYAKTIRFSNGDQLIIENITGTVQKPLDTDYRVAKIGLNEKGEEMIISPYLEIMGSDKNDPSKAQTIKDYNQFDDKRFQASADGANAIALGREADARNENSLALGYMAEAGTETSGVNTVAVGYKAHALSNNAVAVGTASFATGNRSIAIGVSNTVSNTTAHPNDQRAWAAGQGSIVLGNEARAITEKARFEEDTMVDINANDSVSIGTRSDARARNAVALGGNLSYTKEENEVLYGVIPGTNRDFGATVGEGADSAIAIGGAYGDFDKDGKIQINDGTIKATYAAATSYGAKGIAIGSGSLIANSEDYLDLQAWIDNDDYQDKRKSYYETRQAYTDAARAFEDFTKAYPHAHEKDNPKHHDYNTLQIALNKAIDEYNTAYNDFAPYIGKKLDLQTKNASDVEDAVAIGTGAHAGVAGSVALGSNSTTSYKDRAGSVSKLTGYDEQTGAGYIGPDSRTSVWRSTAASVSVGGGTTTYINAEGEEVTDTVTRRITNVAAGVYDTDAVNVAQLKRAATLNVDNRNVAISHNKAGELVINSPFIHVEGVKAASDALAIVDYGSKDNYKAELETEQTNLEIRIKSFEKSIDKLESDITTLEIKRDSDGKGKYPKPSETIKNGYQALIDEATLEKTELEARLTKAKTDLGNVNTALQNYEADFAAAEKLVAKQSKAYGEESLALGKGSVVGEVDSPDKGKQSIAVGVGNTVTGNNSIGIGTKLTVTGNNSGAIGDPSVIDGENSYSVGNGNEIGEELTDVFALGNNIKISNEKASHSVFLGSNSAYTATGKSTAGVDEYGNPVKINGTDYTFAGATPAGVVSVGDKGKERRIQNVAAGLISAESTDAINGSQLYAAMQALSVDVIGDTTETKSTIVNKTPANKTPSATEEGSTGTGTGTGTGEGTATEINLTPSTTFEVKASTTTIDNKDGLSDSGNLKIKETTTDDPKSYKYNIDLSDDIKVKSVKAGDNTTINNDGISIAGGSSPVNLTNTGLNVGDTTVNDSGVTIQNGPSMTAADGFKYGDTTVNNDGLTIEGGPSVKKDGIDAGKNKITNVADGDISANSTDAVSGSQLYSAIDNVNHDITNLGNQISNVDNRARKGIAGAAALAALHPMEFDPDDKVDLPALPEIKAPTPFPDNLDNKWAYDKLEELEQQGYIKGFAGRTLSRNEFAAALDTAMARGAKLDERIVKEFEPELSHVRIAHVEGKGNEEGQWYERPRFSHDKVEKNGIAKKQYRIQPNK